MMPEMPLPHEPAKMEAAVKMWRGIVHAYFMSGLTNRDGIAALCDAAYDELGWIDSGMPDPVPPIGESGK